MNSYSLVKEQCSIIQENCNKNFLNNKNLISNCSNKLKIHNLSNEEYNMKKRKISSVPLHSNYENDKEKKKIRKLENKKVSVFIDNSLKIPSTPSQVIFPENDGSVESLLLTLKVPPTQDVFQIIIQNAMGNTLSLEEKKEMFEQPTSSNKKKTERFYLENVADSSQRKKNKNNKRSYGNVEKENESLETKYFPTPPQSPTQSPTKSPKYKSQLRSKEVRQRLQQKHKQKRRASCDFIDLVSQVPYWVNWDSIEKGQNVFWKYGIPLWLSTSIYAMTKGATFPLSIPDPTYAQDSQMNDNDKLTEELSQQQQSQKNKQQKLNKKKNENKLKQKFLETSQLIMQCMTEDSLKPGGTAWKSLIQIRCRHAQSRVDFIDNYFDIQDMYDYLSEGLKCYNKENQPPQPPKKRNRPLTLAEELMEVERKKKIKEQNERNKNCDYKIIEFVCQEPNSENENIYNIENNNNNENIFNFENNNNNGNMNERNNSFNDIYDIGDDSSYLYDYKDDTNYPVYNIEDDEIIIDNNDDGNHEQINENNSIVPPLSPSSEKKQQKLFKKIMSIPVELLDSIFPINQVSLAKTILYLSIGSINAMERAFNIKLTNEDSNNYLLVWRYIAWLCGLEDKRGRNYGNKIITPKYSKIAIDYLMDNDPFIKWDDISIGNAKNIIDSLSSLIPFVGSNPIVKSIINEIARKIIYSSEMNNSQSNQEKENSSGGFSIVGTLVNNFNSFMNYCYSTIRNYNKKNGVNDYQKITDKDIYMDEIKKNERNKNKSQGSSLVNFSSNENSFNMNSNNYYDNIERKKHIDHNTNLILGEKSMVSYQVAIIVIELIKLFCNPWDNIMKNGISFINKNIFPKLIWFANDFKWIDFSRKNDQEE